MILIKNTQVSSKTLSLQTFISSQSCGNGYHSLNVKKLLFRFCLTVWGFGAKYEGVVHHAFQCGTSTQCSGVDGVLQAYRHVFQTGLIMSRPTDFTEVIQVASAFAQSDLVRH